MGNQSLPVWLTALPECSRLSWLRCFQTATGPELPEGQHRGDKCKRVISTTQKKRAHLQHIHTVSRYFTYPQWNNVAKTKYGHLKVLETCYLTTSVGVIILENESEVLGIVGLEEAIDLCLAEHRGAEENMRPTELDFWPNLNCSFSSALVSFKNKNNKKKTLKMCALTWWAPAVGRQEATALGASPVRLRSCDGVSERPEGNLEVLTRRAHDHPITSHYCHCRICENIVCSCTY